MSPFDGPVPLVVGVAWEDRVAQLALVVEPEDGDFDEDGWRELLFAAGGLRHHLSSGERPALGVPVVLAIVDGEVRDRLCEVVEDLTANYALFDRVDLNLVSPAAAHDDAALDNALAPLLPRCREVGEATIGPSELERFWNDLRAEVRVAAKREAGDAAFDEVRERIADELANELIEDADRLGQLAAPAPVSELVLSNFRSFEKAKLPLGPVTILQGVNGSGKTSLIEALELLWASDTQRRPDDEEDDDGSPTIYTEHLRRDGEKDFVISGTYVSGEPAAAVTQVGDQPRAELARCVLTQDQVTRLVNSSPKKRMRLLTAITGLEIPDLDGRTKSMRDRARRQLDDALADCGMDPLGHANANGLDHVRRQLGGGYLDWAPKLSLVVGAEQALAQASDGAYRAHDWKSHADLAGTLSDLDAKLEALGEHFEDKAGAVRTLRGVGKEVRKLAGQVRKRARPIGALADRLAAVAESRRPTTSPARRAGPIEPGLAARWHAHAQGLDLDASAFEAAVGAIDDDVWRGRLERYVQAVRHAAELAPRDDLRRLASGSGVAIDRERIDVPAGLFTDARFDRAPEHQRAVLTPLRELSLQLNRYSTELEQLAEQIDLHPAPSFVERSSRLLAALCRFQIARAIRRKGPTDRASKTLLSDLLSTRLEPVLQELVSAMSRFEWYFKPLLVSSVGKKLSIAGGATTRADLDIRMLLNSAERTVVGLSWFLALHLLQHPDRRRVLVLDDPGGALDSSNLAGFTATLRAFVRLVRPEQLIVATHDDATALALQDELAPVGDWPESVARIRCRRDGNVSVARPEDPITYVAALSREEELLGVEAG